MSTASSPIAYKGELAHLEQSPFEPLSSGAGKHHASLLTRFLEGSCTGFPNAWCASQMLVLSARISWEVTVCWWPPSRVGRTNPRRRWLGDKGCDTTGAPSTGGSLSPSMSMIGVINQFFCVIDRCSQSSISALYMPCLASISAVTSWMCRSSRFFSSFDISADLARSFVKRSSSMILLQRSSWRDWGAPLHRSRSRLNAAR